MMVREMTHADLEYMKEHSINPKLPQGMAVNYMFALEHEGELMLICGFRSIVPETAWAWLDLTESAPKYMITIYRFMKNLMQDFAEDNGIHRYQAFVRDIPEHIRLVEHLGFELESLMKEFYGNEDAFMYRKLIQWDS